MPGSLSARSRLSAGSRSRPLWSAGTSTSLADFCRITRRPGSSRRFTYRSNRWQMVGEMPEGLDLMPMLRSWTTKSSGLPAASRVTIPDPRDRRGMALRHRRQGTGFQGHRYPAPRGGGGLVRLGRRLHYFGGFAKDRQTKSGRPLGTRARRWDELGHRAAPLPEPRGQLGVASGRRIHLRDRRAVRTRQHGWRTSIGCTATIRRTDIWAESGPAYPVPDLTSSPERSCGTDAS